MVVVLRNGPMVQNMKVNTKTERSTAKGASHSLTAVHTAGPLKIMKFQE
jgi:hypothetical protein